MEEKRLVIVGVNDFISEEKSKPQILKVDAELERLQVARLTNLKRSRDNEAVKNALSDLEKAARGTQNLMPFILRAVRCYSTLGEISNTLRNVFGEFRENLKL